MAASSRKRLVKRAHPAPRTRSRPVAVTLADLVGRHILPMQAEDEFSLADVAAQFGLAKTSAHTVIERMKAAGEAEDVGLRRSRTSRGHVRCYRIVRK